MNKYSEAFKQIKEIVLDDEADGYYQPRTVQDYYYNQIDTLQELVEKATPKPLKEMNPTGYKNYSCPTCGCCLANEGSYALVQRTNKEFGQDSYCSRCGQALLWSDIERKKEPKQLKIDWSE